MYTKKIASPNSFNVDKVKIMFKNDPEYQLLIDIASGIVLDLDPEFKVLNIPPPFRNLQHQLINTYRKSCLKLWNKGKGILLPIVNVPSNILSQCHFSDLHWTVKPGN